MKEKAFIPWPKKRKKCFSCPGKIQLSIGKSATRPGKTVKSRAQGKTVKVNRQVKRLNSPTSATKGTNRRTSCYDSVFLNSLRNRGTYGIAVTSIAQRPYSDYWASPTLLKKPAQSLTKSTQSPRRDLTRRALAETLPAESSLN